MSDRKKEDGSKMPTVVKHVDSDALEKLIARANAKKGYPWVGLQATGCRHVGEGPHVADEKVRTESVSTVFTDDQTGEFCAFATPDVLAELDDVIAEAAQKVNDGNGDSDDAKIATISKTEKDPV